MNNEYEGGYVLQLPTVCLKVENWPLHWCKGTQLFVESGLVREPSLDDPTFLHEIMVDHIWLSLFTIWNFHEFPIHPHFPPGFFKDVCSFVPCCPFKVPFNYQIFMFISIRYVSVSPTTFQLLIFLGIRNSSFFYHQNDMWLFSQVWGASNKKLKPFRLPK